MESLTASSSPLSSLLLRLLARFSATAVRFQSPEQERGSPPPPPTASWNEEETFAIPRKERITAAPEIRGSVVVSRRGHLPSSS